MPGMTLGGSQSQRPHGSTRGSVVPTGRSVFSRFWLPPGPSTMPSLCLASIYDTPDVVQTEGRRKETSGQATSSVEAADGWLILLAMKEDHVPRACWPGPRLFPK